MSFWLVIVLARSECLRVNIGSDGPMPAETGVEGLRGKGDLISGSGKEIVLRRASIALRSWRLANLFGESPDVVNGEPEEDVGRERGRLFSRLVGGEPLGSGALVTRPPSLIVRLGLFACAAVTVCALASLGCAFSDTTSSTGWGFLPWATARGPAQ